MKLRYTGTRPATFMSLGRELEPDETFDVPFDKAPAFLGRTDIERVLDAPAPAPPKQEEPPPEEASDEPAPQAPDDTVTL